MHLFRDSLQLVNHGIPETLIQGIIDAAKEFFDLPEDEKQNVSDPIKYGNGSVITTSNQKIFLWKDLLKSPLHPEFHCPVKPPNLR